MKFSEKLQNLRKEYSLSQEDLAEKMNISRQAIAKWESDIAYPDIDNFIQLSNLFQVTIDSLVKSESKCSKSTIESNRTEQKEIISFLCIAKRKCYAGNAKEEKPSRLNSHDLLFKEKEKTYIDTYLGGEKFSGEEAIWVEGQPVWAMNYTGRVLSEQFSVGFLKECLLLVPEETPFRGPSIYQNGKYIYHCKVTGDFNWFHGKEEIFYCETMVYECYFHGGLVK